MGTRRRIGARSQRTWLLAAIATGGVAAAADPPPLPEGFLEYLGSWETDDADWVVANAAGVASAARSADPQPPQPTTIEQRGAVQSPATTTERKP
jgi:hypothetical protein